jgi:hypothetical protein
MMNFANHPGTSILRRLNAAADQVTVPKPGLNLDAQP